MRTKIEEALGNMNEQYIAEALDDMGKKRPVTSVFLRLTAVAAALIIAAVGTLTGAVALGSMTAYRVVHELLPGFAESLTPVRVTCEDQGIRMTVEGVRIDGGSAEIRVSLTDLVGDRVDETTDLFDSYTIHSTADGSYGCVPVGFDEKTRTKTFMIHIDQDEPINGDKLDFSVRTLLTGKTDQVYRLLPIEGNIEEAKNVTDSAHLNTSGGFGGWEGDPEPDFDRVVPILVPNPDQTFEVTDGVHVTAWGLIDGVLHVQVLYDDILNRDNHGSVYYESNHEEGPHYGVSFWDDNRVNSYEEYLFEGNTPESFEMVNFYGRFITTPADARIDGNWDVSIILKDTE